MNENAFTELSKTNWERLRMMDDDEIDTSDIPPLGEDFFRNAKVRFPEGKVPVLINLDQEVADWFRKQDGNFQLNVNNALRQYAETHQ